MGTRYSTLISKEEHWRSRHFEVQVYFRENSQSSDKEITKTAAAQALEQSFFVKAQALYSESYYI